MNISVAEAILSICKECQFIVKDNSIEDIEWLNTDISIIPDVESIQEELDRLQKNYNSLEYQRLRKNAYPSIEDQLDTLYHQGYDGWREMINNIKQEFPKLTVGE